MKLLLQSYKWDCLPTAAAMVMDVMPKEIFEFLGHDGSEILWPDLPEPLCRRSFSIDEIIDFAVANVFYPVEIRASTPYGPTDEHWFTDDEKDTRRLVGYMNTKSGVLVGNKKVGGKPHAVAWNHEEQLIYDPDGEKYLKEDFEIFSFFAFY